MNNLAHSMQGFELNIVVAVYCVVALVCLLAFLLRLLSGSKKGMFVETVFTCFSFFVIFFGKEILRGVAPDRKALALWTLFTVAILLVLMSLPRLREAWLEHKDTD
jgi:hypothetical protein